MGLNRGAVRARSNVSSGSTRGPRKQAREAAGALGRFNDDEREAFLDYLRYSASPGMLEALLPDRNKDIDKGMYCLPCACLRGPPRRRRRDRAVLFRSRHLSERIPGRGSSSIRKSGTLP